MWEIAENLHRLDLTKEQRDEHIRRYAELLETKASLVPQNAAPTELRSDGRRKGPQHEKAIPRQIAEETGLSVDTVRRALKPAPVANLVSVKEAETDEEAIIREANAIVSAWNRAPKNGFDDRARWIEGLKGIVWKRLTYQQAD